MEIKILQVFYGKDGLPYKDKDRQVHFPITGTGFLGASNTTKIKFYYDELDNLDETTWVAVSKLPNGKVGSRVLESYLDEELNEHYALLELDNYYTQYKGDVFISLQGYQGGVDFDYDEENSQYEIHGTPTIAATGSIKFTINYANQFVGSGETDNINFQRILAALGTKLGMREYSEHVEELPSEGSPDVFYVVNDDPNNPNLANIYVWNKNTSHYIWVGDNTLDLGEYYTKEQGEQFEEGIDNRVTSVENELSSVAQGSPKGVYATVSALESAYPTGTSGIFVVQEDGHWYYWNGSAWTDGGQYLAQLSIKQTRGTSETDVMSQKAVNDALLPLDKIIDIDFSSATTGYINPNNGNVIDGYSGYKHFFIYATSGNKLTWRTYANESVVGIAFYKIDGTFISGVVNTSSEQNATIPDGTYKVGISYRASQEDVCYFKLNSNFAKLSQFLNNSLSKYTEFDTTNAQEGYINKNTGVIVQDNRYEYIEEDVIPGGYILYRAGTNESIVGIAFYNKSGDFISGVAGKQAIQYIQIPENADKVRIPYALTSTTFLAEMFFDESVLKKAMRLSLLNIKSEVIVDINGNGDFTSLLRALKGTSDNVVIRIKKGTYNIIDEYEDYYGDTYFTNYTGYSGTSDVFNRGLWLGKGRKIIGEAGVVLNCVYEGNNTNVQDYFSVIANDSDVSLENVTIKFGNIRYAIHDDFQPEHGTVTWKNIHFDGTPVKAAPIGGGFGLNTTYYIEGCTFKNNSKDWDINYHASNNAETHNICFLYVKNCKGLKKFGVWSNGPSTEYSECFVSNCEFSEIVNYEASTTDHPNVNMTTWCNNTTN